MVGIEKSNTYQYFNILYGLGHNLFFGEVTSEYTEFGSGKVVYEFITLMHIMRVLRGKWVG